jgi:hypothetical protein
MTATNQDTVRGNRSMGHMALHYGRPEEGPIAAKLLKLLGFIETQELPLPDGTRFYRFVLDEKHQGRGDGIIFLSAVPEAQRALVETVRTALKVGSADEHPTVKALRANIDNDPEYCFHYGTLMESLEDLEDKFQKLRDANENDPELKGRLKLTFNRPIPDNPDIEARLDASPIFGGVTRRAYGKNGVQAFVETDILSSGTLGDSMILEFDYVFPEAKNHILSVVEWA